MAMRDIIFVAIKGESLVRINEHQIRAHDMLGYECYATKKKLFHNTTRKSFFAGKPIRVREAI